MLKFPKVMKYPDGYVNTGSLGFPFPRVFWKCHRFFNAATGHIPFIWLKGKMSMNSRSGYLILASLICSRKLSVSFLYWTVRVQVGSAQDSVGESSSPIRAVPKKAVKLAVHIVWIVSASQPDRASRWPM